MPELVNVPDVDGVPAVLFAAGVGSGIVLATADAIGIPLVPGSSPWGLYRDGVQVVEADTVLAFDHKEDWAIADYPIERGGFESYNKVAIPFDVRFVFVTGGSEAARSALIASIDPIMGDLNLYDAVTPEKVYQNLNVIHRDMRRTAQSGVGAIAISLWCQEVRQVAASAGGTTDPSSTGDTGETAADSGADQTNGGTVQATDATTGQAASANVGDQAFAGGYDVSGYNVNGQYEGDVGELTVSDGATGEPLPEGTVPGSTGLPQTTSTISGFSPAGPDTFTTLNVGLGGLS